MDDKIIQLREYVRILKDAPYALKTYLTTYDNTQKKYVPLDLFPDQIQLINDYEKYNENITRKYRQAGVTTVTAAWISRRLQIAKPENPERVLVIANKRDTAIEMANKIRHFLDQWPDWINVGFSVDKNSESRFRLNNGCEVKAVATSADALRGYTPTILIFDEAAYIEAGDDFWAASMASLSCVHEDSYILTNNGLIQLKDIVVEKEKIGFTKYNGNLKVINKDLKITNIKNTFKSEKSKCYKIQTKSGFELIGSYKHPLLTNKDGDDEWEWMENLKLGDKIKIQYNQNLFGEDNEIVFPLKHGNENEKYKLPKKLSDDLNLPYLMGLYIAEGSFSKNTIQICNGDIDIEKFLLDFGFIKNRKNHFYYTSSYLQRFFFEYVGMKKTIAKDKEIPNYILQSSKIVIKSFLQGMFDGDGCVFKNGIKYSSTSKKLINQLQILLSNFGVRSYIRYSEQKTSKTSILKDKNHITKIYNLFIKNEFIPHFYNEIGFRLERKQNKKEFFINKIKNSIHISANKNELKTILKENNITRTEYEKSYRFLDILMRKNGNHISYHSYEKLISKNLKNKNTLLKWIKRYEESLNYYYEEIINIETFEDYTYDLEIPDGSSFISNSIISHNTGGKIILISTPNGFDPIYHGVYEQSVRKLNNFHVTDLRWFKDPRYSKDLRWVKCTDICDYMLNRERYNDDEVVMYDFDIEKYNDYIEMGYKPFSSWFESMSKKFKYDRRKISQELEADFLGSGDGVIPGSVQQNISKNLIREPKEKYMQGTFWQWKEPIQGHRYIMGCDVSRGDSEDFSSINIIDFDEREQVAEYIGKIPPDDLATICYKWGVLYEAFIVVDITGGMGIATSRKLQEMNYKNLYIDGVNTKNIWEYNRKSLDKIPGINFNNKRTQIIAAFEEQLRKDFKVRSSRLLNELSTFVYINGRPDHMKGHHDDSIMSLSMALYAADMCFNQLEKNENANKAMLESWTLSERTYETKKSFYSYGVAFDSIGALQMNNPDNNYFLNTPTKDNYKEFSWLFSKRKK